ncbi:MAG: glycoside hydrolase family 127 protein [Clostridiales bacterium]|nr:glycoside hydrolase family 127 protein [Clostridiales bacterium]
MLSQAPIKSVLLTDGFLYNKNKTNQEITLQTQYLQLLETGRLYCMRMDWKDNMPNRPHQFWDSDVAKWIEALAYSLASHPNGEFEKKADEIIDIMESSQLEDGYLNTYFQTVAKGKRFTNLKDDHELYCAGHLIEASIAYYLTTKKDKFLNIMCRYADLLCSVFGKDKGQLHGYPGHEEIELALIKLYRLTNETKYLDLATYFVLERGKQPNYFDIEKANARNHTKFNNYKIPTLKSYAYIQAHMPILEQKEVVGHSVRALYYLAGVADVAYETNNHKLIKTCHRLYSNLVEKKMYITGGIGSSLKVESFSFDYDLPNDLAYAETCAAIALIFFTNRMFLYEKDGQYLDVLERALYNGVLSGMSLDGTSFFYSNPLEVKKQAVDMDVLGLKSNMGYERKKWFGCACCPPNIARLLSSLGSYVYATDNHDIYVSLYTSSTFTNKETTLLVKTNYPFDETININMDQVCNSFNTLYLRIPSWCSNYTVKVNKKNIVVPLEKGFIKITRSWQKDDKITLNLSMPVTKVMANPKVRQNINKLALQRGPIVYCLEQVDNSDDLFSLYMSKDDKFTIHYDQSLLGGCTYLIGNIKKAVSSHKLYSKVSPIKLEDTTIKAIPYALFANRAPGDMIVWINRRFL